MVIPKGVLLDINTNDIEMPLCMRVQVTKYAANTAYLMYTKYFLPVKICKYSRCTFWNKIYCNLNKT